MAPLSTILLFLPLALGVTDPPAIDPPATDAPDLPFESEAPFDTTAPFEPTPLPTLPQTEAPFGTDGPVDGTPPPDDYDVYGTADPDVYGTADPDVYGTADPDVYGTADPDVYGTAEPTSLPPFDATGAPTAEPAADVLGCEPSDMPGYTCKIVVVEGVHDAYFGSDGDTLDVMITALNDGWVAWGISPGAFYAGSSAVVATEDPLVPEVLTLMRYELDDEAFPTPDDLGEALEEGTATREDGTLMASFSYAGDTVPIINGLNYFYWALGDTVDLVGEPFLSEFYAVDLTDVFAGIAIESEAPTLFPTAFPTVDPTASTEAPTVPPTDSAEVEAEEDEAADRDLPGGDGASSDVDGSGAGTSGAAGVRPFHMTAILAAALGSFMVLA